MSCLYILEIKPLSVTSFAIIFSYSVGCLFIFQKFLNVTPVVCILCGDKKVKGSMDNASLNPDSTLQDNIY